MTPESLVLGHVPNLTSATNKTSYFKRKLEVKHPELYNSIDVLEEYVSTRDKILIKNEYGVCSISPNQLFKGCLPNLKSAIDKTSYWVNQAKEVHGDKYDYSKVKYVKSKTKICIVCRTHGEFWQKPVVHLSNKAGCQKCSDYCIGFRRTDFINICNKGGKSKAILYLVRLFNDEEDFYKVGITSRSVIKRMSQIKVKGYDYEILEEVNLDPGKCWDLEKEIHRKNKHLKYTPTTLFGGSTECFSERIKIKEEE